MNPPEPSSPVAETDPAQPVSETWFTVVEAVDATRSSRSTIKRRLAEQAFPNAKQSDGSEGYGPGTWLIPKGDLLEAGFRLYAPSPPDSTQNQDQILVDLNHEPPVEGSSESVNQLQRELAETRRDLDNERHAKELARMEAEKERRASALLQDHVDSLNRAMRILDAGPRPTRPRTEPRVETPARKRHWWLRN